MKIHFHFGKNVFKYIFWWDISNLRIYGTKIGILWNTKCIGCIHLLEEILCKCTQQFGDVFLLRWWITSRNAAAGIAGYILNTSEKSQEIDDDASVASGNKRHLAIIKIVVPIVTYKITFSLANFASIIFNQISFPIFYSLHELCATIGKTSILHK